MDKQTDSQLSKLQEYLQSHREKNSLSLKIKFNVHQNLPILQVIQEELARLTHLTDLTLHISQHTILTNEGYSFLSNAVLNLNALMKLSIKIDSSCFLENQGLSILQDMINNLPQLACLKIKIGENNYINQESAQQLLDTLSANTKLTTLNFYLENIQNSTTNEGNIHFWRGISNLSNLESLKIYLNVNNYDSSDLTELFALITQLKKLRSLHLILQNGQSQNTCLLVELFSYIGKMIELSSLKVKYLARILVTLKGIERETILRNLSNLKFLEQLKLYSIEQVLFNDSLGEYINLIRDLKYLKGLQLNIQNNQLYAPDNIMSLGKSLLELNNLVNLELVFGLKSDELWRGFLQELPVSFSKMLNLLSLKLEFQQSISSKICDILGKSLRHLQCLERFDLKLTFGIRTIKLVLLSGIRKLSNIKELEILIKDDTFEDEEVTTLLDSIVELKLLERLCLERIKYSDNGNNGIWNLKALCNTLVNLRKLKYLSFGLSINDLDSDNQLEMLERCFDNLQNLEYLQLQLIIVQKSENLQNRSLIHNLTNLKKLVINFPNLPLNIFGMLNQSEQKLEYCQLTFKEIRAQQLIEIIESLSQSTIKSLNLNLEKISQDFSQYQEQFGIACSHLSSLEKLQISDNNKSGQYLITYFHGIKQMKQLKSLSIKTYNNTLDLEDVEEINGTLKQLNNLQKITLELLYFGFINGDVGDIASLKSLKSFGNLKHIQFHFFQEIEDEVIQRNIKFTNACSLDLQQENQKSLLGKINQIEDVAELQNQVEFKQPLLSLENELKLEDSFQKVTQVLNPIESNINIWHKNYKEPKISLNEFDFQNTRYLNHLEIRYNFDQQTPVDLEILNLRDLTSESKLTKLELQLQNVILNEELIRYLSRNFQFLTNLEQLEFDIIQFKDYYYLLFDSFKFLVNLKELTVFTNISDNAAVSLGNSLKALTKLQICYLRFEKSSIKWEGISTILSGLKQATRLINLSLMLNTDQIFENKDSELLLSDCITSLKYLEEVSFSLEINHIDSNYLSDFLTSIGSLVHLTTLSLEINEANPFNQEMLDDLIEILNKSTVDKKYISIYLENDKQIQLSQNFANCFNKKNWFTIQTEETQMLFNFPNFTFIIQSQNFNNLQMNFLEYLRENIKVLFQIKESKILKCFRILKKCPSRKIVLKLLKLSDEQDVDIVCGFILKMVNLFELEMEVSLSNSGNIEDSIKQITESLTKLNTLKVLNLKFPFEQKFYDDQQQIMPQIMPQIMIALKILKDMQQLQEFYLKTSNRNVNEQLIPIIKKLIFRQVIFNSSKQIKSSFYY